MPPPHTVEIRAYFPAPANAEAAANALREAGYADAEIEEMKAGGIVG